MVEANRGQSHAQEQKIQEVEPHWPSLAESNTKINFLRIIFDYAHKMRLP